MTVEGQAKYAELEKHFAAGDEVELQGEYIDAFEFPEWWTRLYGETVKPALMQIGPPEPKEFHPAQIQFVSPTGEERIPYVELWKIKQGGDEITLSNNPQNYPFEFSIVLHREAHHQNKFSLSGKYSNLDNEELLRFLKIQKILSVGGSIRITFLDIGNTIVVPAPPNCFSEPNQSALDFIEKVCFVEKSTGTELNFPEDMSFTREDIQAADKLVSVIKNGHYQQHNKAFNVRLQKQGVALLLEKHKEGSSLSFQNRTEEKFVEIFSERINMGAMIQEIKGALDMSREEAQVWCKQAKDEDTFAVRLINAELFEEFKDWPKT